MNLKKLHKLSIPTDRWSARVVSPINISGGLDTAAYGEVVVVHPGWGKSPERYAGLLWHLADKGFLPIGIDTRYAYSDRKTPRSRFLVQPPVVGDSNPYFDTFKRSDNRWEYRRPTVLLDICERIGVGKRSYVGHSDRGRIAVLATVARPEAVDNLVIVNAAGTGSSANGLARMVKSNRNRLGELFVNPDQLVSSSISAIGSLGYTVTHLRRTIGEHSVIQRTNTWELLDRIKYENVGVTVLHAMGDELVSFDDSELQSRSRQWINFIATSGSHSNVYEPKVQKVISQALVSN